MERRSNQTTTSIVSEDSLRTGLPSMDVPFGGDRFSNALRIGARLPWMYSSYDGNVCI